MLGALLCIGQELADPWNKTDLIEPASLAASLDSAQRPTVISVAFPVLYRNRHITGALNAGAASTPEGIEALTKLVSGIPKQAAIVIYCGCCPMGKCPNVRPAYVALKQMGFQQVTVLHIPTNMAADWYSKGYPSERPSVAR